LTAARATWLLLVGAACLEAPPSAGSAPGDPHSLHFFGSSYRDDGIDRAWIVAERPSPVGRIGQNDFCVELWLKVEAEDIVPVDSCPPAWFGGTILLDRGFFNGPQNGDIGMSVYRTGTGSGVVATFDVVEDRVNLCGDAPVDDGRWHHVALTRDASDNLAIWVDGVLDAMAPGPAGDGSYALDLVEPLLEGDRYMVLGGPKYAEDPSPGFAGRIDDVRLSRDARYLTGFEPPYPPLEADDVTLALYTFDEGQGVDIANSVGPAGNGQLRVDGEPDDYFLLLPADLAGAAFALWAARRRLAAAFFFF
jgi:hypothetical protein